MKRMRFSGTIYRGMDPETREMIDVKNGDVVMVSDGKAAQLVKDFPNQWNEQINTVEPKKKEAASKKKSK